MTAVPYRNQPRTGACAAFGNVIAAVRPGEEAGEALARRRDRIRHMDVTAADLEAAMRSSGNWDPRVAMWTQKLLAFSKGGHDITIRNVRIVEICPGCSGAIQVHPMNPAEMEATARTGDGPAWHCRCLNEAQDAMDEEEMYADNH